MNELEFYPKNKKINPIWKFFSMLLLSSGASSAADLEKVIVGNKVIIKTFLADDIVMEFKDIEIVNDINGNPVEIATKTDVFKLYKMNDPLKFLEAIKERIKNLYNL